MPDTLVTIASYILPLFAIIVLIRCMRIFDIFSKGGVWVNGEKVQATGTVVRDGDVLNLAGNSVRFRDISEKQRDAIEARRTQSWKRVHPAVTLFFLTIFQAILLLEHLCTA